MSRRVLSVVLALFALAPVRAHAWTDAAVRSVQAQVVLDREARARVTLTATVRVHGGWLEGVELAGLDPDLELDETATPWAVDGDGRRYRPRVRKVRDGRVQISFPGTSPRRGQVTVGLTYHTALAHRATEPLEGEDRVRVRWTLPGFRSGLDGVQIEVVAPPGSRMGPRDPRDTGASLQRTTEAREDGTALRWRRAHLPRTTPWTVRVDVPAEALAEPLRGPPVLAPPPPPPAAEAPPRDPTPFWLGLAGLLALVALAKLAAVARLARLARSRARPLLPLPGLVRALLALAACAGGALLALEQRPVLGLAALAGAALAAAYRPGAPPPGSRLGAWRAADARWIAASRGAAWRRWLSPAGLLDATTPLGALHLAGWLAAPWVLSAFDAVAFEVRLLAPLLPLPILGSGTRLSFPRGPAESLRALLAVARRLRSLPSGVALRPVMHVDVRGTVQDARVRTVLDHRPAGLLRLDLALGQTPHAGGWDATPMLVVVTRANSPADAALAAALGDLPGRESRGGRRVLRRVPVEGRSLPLLERVVAAVADCPAAPAPSRGTAAPQETVRDLPAPHAVGF
jgi:hypothetical protein